MTAKERQSPRILNASRKRRIALGSGTSVPEVNQLLRQYKQTRKLMKKIGKRGLPNMGKWPL
jgi:signal recognition particle subunit SRP54